MEVPSSLGKPLVLPPFSHSGLLGGCQGTTLTGELTLSNSGQRHILQSPGRNCYPVLCVSSVPGHVLNAILVLPCGILAITLSERGHPLYMSKPNLREMTSQSSPLKSGPKRGRWEGGSRGRGLMWLAHVDVWQKQKQYCKAITLQLKINKLKIESGPNGGPRPIIFCLCCFPVTSSPCGLWPGTCPPQASVSSCVKGR